MSSTKVAQSGRDSGASAAPENAMPATLDLGQLTAPQREGAAVHRELTLETLACERDDRRAIVTPVSKLQDFDTSNRFAQELRAIAAGETVPVIVNLMGTQLDQPRELLEALVSAALARRERGQPLLLVTADSRLVDALARHPLKDGFRVHSELPWAVRAATEITT